MGSWCRCPGWEWGGNPSGSMSPAGLDQSPLTEAPARLEHGSWKQAQRPPHQGTSEHALAPWWWDVIATIPPQPLEPFKNRVGEVRQDYPNFKEGKTQVSWSFKVIQRSKQKRQEWSPLTAQFYLPKSGFFYPTFCHRFSHSDADFTYIHIRPLKTLKLVSSRWFSVMSQIQPTGLDLEFVLSYWLLKCNSALTTNIF